MTQAETERRKPRLTRREFLKAAAYVGLAAYGGELLTKLSNEDRYVRCLEALTFRALPYRKPMLFKRGGVGFNVVYAGLRPPREYNRTLDFAAANNATFLRVFLDRVDDRKHGIIYDYEPEIGNFRESVLSGFTGFLRNAAQRGFSLIVVGSDGHRMGRCLTYNPIYGRGGEAVLSPYYVKDAPGGPWWHFYTDQDLYEAHMRRNHQVAGAVREALADELKKGDIQLYFEPMNEPQPQSQEKMNDWLLRESSELRKDFGFDCLSGTYDPDTVTAPVVPTAHYFPYILEPQEGKIGALMNGKNVFLEEGGEMSQLLGIGLDQDIRLRDYLTKLYFRINAVDWQRKTVQPLAQPAMCLWHADQDHEDGYLIDPGLPQALTLIRGISTQYQAAVTV